MSRPWKICTLLVFGALAACSSGDGNGGGPSSGAGGAAGTFANAGLGAGAGAGGAASAGAGAMAGAGGASGASAGASGASAGATGGGTPTYTRVWTEVLEAKGCAGEFCHGSGQGGLSMDSKADAYLNLVGVAAAGPACSASGKMRVVAGNPEASLLFEKISSNPMPSCGDRMPIGARLEPDCLTPDPSVCTTQAEIQLVRDWIMAGALDN
jgi:hypothetical protein